jgi:hypothetical protein
MKARLLLLLSTAAVAICAGAAAAAGLPLETLPASARWMLHLDAAALRDSPLGREILAAIPGTPAEAELNSFAAMTGCNVRSDLAAISACGSGGAEQGVVIYLRGSWAPRKIQAALAANSPVTTTAHGRHTILNCTDAAAPEGFARQSFCLASSNLVLLANREAALRQALDALDGSAPALSGVPRFRRLAAMDTNTILRVIATNLQELVAGSPQAAALPAADSVQLALNMEGAVVRLKAVVKTRTPEAARQMQQVLLGFQVVLMLQGGKKPEIAKIAKAARVDVSGQDVTVILHAPPEVVRKLLAACRI